jgi:hypothetical protein
VLEAVTVVEHPEWGALTGTVTAGADEGWVLDPANLLNNVPFFTVLSGPCTTAAVNGHFCVGRWPGGYSTNEHCDILVGGGGSGGAAGGTLGPCPIFDISTASDWGGSDSLGLAGGRGYTGDDCPARALLAAGETLTWTSDGGSQGNQGGNGLPWNGNQGAGGGWQICFA